MSKACCGSARDQRIEQYELSNWKINEATFKTFNPGDTLFAAEYVEKEKDGVYLLIDPTLPNWMSVNGVGTEILKLCNGQNTFADIQKKIAGKFPAVDPGTVKREVAEFLNASGTLQFVSEHPIEKTEYSGRNKIIAPDKLDELWIYNTLACNLRCKHCLVSAGAKLKEEMSTSEMIKLVDDAVELGVKRIYITGGEPFIKEDIFEIIEYITREKELELIVLSNATLFDDKKIAKLENLKGPKLILQVSLEGPDAEIHDNLRGEGSFDKTVDGIKRLSI